MIRVLTTCFFVWILISIQPLQARILPVGSSKTFATIQAAAALAQAGDTILCLDEVIQGGMYIENLQGEPGKLIYILASQPGITNIRGGSNSIQFSDAKYLRIEGFVISGQTGNGMNLDDGSTYATPSAHIQIVNCIFENISATGNNDLLKLSGIDSFLIRGCVFRNGAAGGSGIDMVGCHYGTIEDCTFTQLGSNSIQAKGGTADLIITRNRFTNGGARALNLGGSTGLAFFRPIDAKYEAARIRVIANVISGSEAPIAYVGATGVEVSNNTLIFPGKWIVRILQETVDPARFVPCGNNRFFNNIVLLDQRVSTTVNVGPNTAPETFAFQHNLWFKTSQPSWSGPQLPGTVTNNWIDDPQLIEDSLYVLKNTSPAIGRGLAYQGVSYLDIDHKPFQSMPTIGAWEAVTVTTNTKENGPDSGIYLYPNPTTGQVTLVGNGMVPQCIRVYDVSGRFVAEITGNGTGSVQTFDVQDIEAGLYLLFDQSQSHFVGTVMIR